MPGSHPIAVSKRVCPHSPNFARPPPTHKWAKMTLNLRAGTPADNPARFSLLT